MKLKDGMTLMATAIAMVVGGGAAAVAASADAGGASDTSKRPASPAKPDSKIGLAVMAGGGVTDFTQSATRSQTTVGGSWDVRALVAIGRP